MADSLPALDETVSVLIPTYNRCARLRKAVQSVLAQTHRDLVVIISDNASTDDTPVMMAREFGAESRVRYIRHDRNHGMVYNFSFLVRQIETPYFVFLTDDDHQLPTFLARALMGFRERPESQFSVVAVPSVTDEGDSMYDQLQAWPREGFFAPGEATPLVAAGYQPIFTGCVFRREIGDEVIFPETTGPASDLLILLTLSAKYPFFVSKEVGLYFVRHGQASSNVEGYRYYCPTLGVVEARIRENPTIPIENKTEALRILSRRIDWTYFKCLFQTLEIRNYPGLRFVAQNLHPRKRWRCRIFYRPCATLLANKIGYSLAIRLVGLIRAVYDPLRKGILRKYFH